MTTEDECGDIPHRDFELETEEVAEPRAVKDAGHAADLGVGQSGILAQCPDHGIERVGDADHERIGRMRLDAVADGLHDLQVDAEKVVAAHARLAGNACSYDADIGTGDVGVVVGPLEACVETRDRPGLGDVERLSLRRAFDDVEEDDVTHFLDCGEVRERSAYLACTDEGDPWSGHESLQSM